MSKKHIFAVALATLALGQVAQAQTNLQVFYDFAKDRGHVTTTLEGFYNDKWGNTFFFVDYDYNAKTVNGRPVSPSGTYFEIARCLNFWQDSFLGDLSLHVEYNGGLLLDNPQSADGSFTGFGINHAVLAGLDYCLHTSDYRNTLNLKVLYKNTICSTSKVPMQFTVVWGLSDLFGITSLRFSGFADFWWQDQHLYPWLDNDGAGYRDWSKGEDTHVVFISEPQLWYSVGQWFGMPNLNIGGEVELSYNFGTLKGFRVRPCAGIKWVF
jgi:hypothetical protein